MAIFAHYDGKTGEISGFYDDGIHAAIPEPSLEIPANQVDDRFGMRVDVSGLEPVLYAHEAPPRAPDGSNVDAERDRRLAAGATVQVEGYGPVPVQGRPTDQVNLLALKDSARDLVAAGITDPSIEFRDGANVLHILTPAQMIDLANKGKAAAAEIYAASWALKDNPPIPADYAADAYWP